MHHVHHHDWNRNGQFSGQTTLTNKVNGAPDKANSDFIELVYPKNVYETKNIVFLAPLMTEIEMVSLVVKRPWPTRSTVHATKQISISLNLSTQKNVGNKWKLFFSACLHEFLLQIWQIIEFFCLEESLWVSLGGQLVNISECVFLEK